LVPVINRPAHDLIVCGVALCAMLSTAACGSSPQPGSPSPFPSESFSVSGRVFEVISGAHVAAADFPVFVRVLSRTCTAPVCTASFSAAQGTRTGADGRYSFRDLPGGRVVITANTAAHAQVCGATSVLSAATQLDVEITSRNNRQPSLTMPPLRVRGQLFQMTPAGRAGVSRGEIALELSLDPSAHTTSTAFFLEVDADADGNYLACGLPANWPIRFISGFEDYQAWHQFSADATLDIERRQP
jgi:hypothetical protein